MKITVIGSGYVGLVSGICFAKIGHDVVCVDKIEEKITKLKSGEIPIFEPGLEELLKECVDNNKISFSTDLTQAIQDSQAIFIAVGTPQDEDGSADLSYVLAAAKEIAQNAKETKLIVTKSTVPAGTGEKIAKLVKETNPEIEFLIASNPEFLREGCAIDDFMNPDRIVIGFDNKESGKILREIYNYFSSQKIFESDIVTAELIKYASNSFLATKISFINEMADLCEKTGANIKSLSQAMGMDERIGNKFLNPGPGFGGSCFPKDILAIINTAKEHDVDLSLISSVIESNKNRKEKFADKILQILDENNKILQILDENKKVALLGLAFKSDTDDIRYSPAIAIAKKLLSKGITIKAHDFEAIENSKRALESYQNISFYDDIYETAKDCDLIVIATEWPQYGVIDLKKLKNNTNSTKIFDLRNILDEKLVKEAGFEYLSIGRK